MNIKLLDTDEYSWLKDSDFYKELDLYETDENYIDVIFCSINEQDIDKYLEVINFWGVNYLPEELFDLFFTIRPIDKIKELYNLTNDELYGCLIDCLGRHRSQIPLVAAENDLLDLMVYCNKKKLLENNIHHLAFMGTKHFHRGKYDGTGNGIFNQACMYGSFNCIKYMISINKYFVNSRAFEFAASSNKSLEIVTYFNKLGYWNWDRNTCSSAAGAGNLLTLKYLHETKGPHRLSCPWDEKTCALAAKGKIECLVYAHENGCPWDDQTIINAAWWNSLECLKYAHEKGCPYDKEQLLFVGRSDICKDYIINKM